MKRSTKSQIANNKYQTNSNNQIINSKHFGYYYFEFRYCLLFDAWNLEFI